MTNLDHLDPDKVPINVLRDRERAYQDRQYKVKTRVTEILTVPDELRLIIEENQVALSTILVGIRKDDYIDGAFVLQKWLHERALSIAEDEIPEEYDE